MTAGKKIRILLIERDMKMAQLAKLLGKSPSTLSDKLKRDNFYEDDLRKIAEVLNYDYEAVFTDRETGKTI